MEENKRILDRIHLTTPIRYQKKGSQRFGNFIGRDISANGIGFVSNEFFPVSTQFIFEFQQPKANNYIKTVGEVVWVSSQPHSERFSAGAKFIEPLSTLS